MRKNLISDKLKHAQNDPQGTWKMINKILKPNVNDTVFNVKVDIKFTYKSKEIATAFNEFFSQVSENLASNNPASSFEPFSQLDRLNANFAFFHVIGDEVKNVILSFKFKSSSLN